MDLVTMRTNLRTQIGSPTTANVADAALTAHINTAYTQICTRYRFHRTRVRATLVTVAGTASYALNSLDLVLLNVWNKTTGRRLGAVDSQNLQSYDDSVVYPANRGAPTKYYRDGNNVVLFPTPDAVYSIELFTQRLPVALSLDADTPVISTPWHDLIVIWARWIYFDTIGDYPKAQHAYNTIQNWVSQQPNEFEDENMTFIHAVDVPTLSISPHSRPSGNFDTEDF